MWGIVKMTKKKKEDLFVMEIMSCMELGSSDCTEISESPPVLDTDVKHG